MKIGTNMTKILNTAKRHPGEYVQVPVNGPSGERAVTSLKRAGLVAVRKKGDVLLVKFNRTAEAASKRRTTRSRSVDPDSKYQQALAYAKRHRSIDRPQLVSWLRDELNMTEAGSNTYATAVLKEARPTTLH